MSKLRKITGMAAGAAAVGAAMFAAPGTASASPAPCGGETRACVDLSANRAWLMDGNGGVTLGGVPVTHGKPGYETPPGVYHVTWKNIDHWSQAYNGPMPYAVFFTDTGIAFHEGSLNSQSHGCVRLTRENAKTFFNSLAPGDVVTVVP
ncbi:L,D-transpeptidase [Actinophytocola xanthii]|uniref:L,D-transpeptidase n=1 Tax=Actinophytocola xanthii TaxID=1912961 RepID=UPI001177C6DD|nr:L,D-transpeptidase [Actinophytocola xanthii]